MEESLLTEKTNDISNRASYKKRILVVDNNGIFLRTTKLMLEPDYEVVLAKSGEKAYTTACSEKIDLILLDYEMPEWDGKKTLEKLRSNQKSTEIPVIFLTGVNDRKHILEVLTMQPQGYLLKPVEREVLHKKIREVI